MKTWPIRYLALTLTSLLVPLAVTAAPVIIDEFVFTERRSATSLFPSSHTLVIGANVTSSEPITSVTATPVLGGAPVNLPFNPSFLDLNEFSRRALYNNEIGQWRISATDATGTSTRLTHVLDDVRDLPLIQGLALTGPTLTPHITWNAVDPLEFPSFCSGPECAVGFDFFTYRVEVRLITDGFARTVFRSPNISTSLPAQFDLPGGVLDFGNDYLIGIRLQHTELEVIRPDGSFFSPLENRSTAFVELSLVPEPATCALLLGGLGLLGLGTRRQRKPTKNRTS